jgi:DNA-binding CsgD family transcriptional regulator
MHRASMLRKLGLHGQTELVRYALEHRLISSEG